LTLNSPAQRSPDAPTQLMVNDFSLLFMEIPLGKRFASIVTQGGATKSKIIVDGTSPGLVLLRHELFGQNALCNRRPS
jgi:hypothetical protein